MGDKVSAFIALSSNGKKMVVCSPNTIEKMFYKIKRETAISPVGKGNDLEVTCWGNPWG
jgi:hypothetical protein